MSNKILAGLAVGAMLLTFTSCEETHDNFYSVMRELSELKNASYECTINATSVSTGDRVTVKASGISIDDQGFTCDLWVDMETERGSTNGSVPLTSIIVTSDRLYVNVKQFIDAAVQVSGSAEIGGFDLSTVAQGYVYVPFEKEDDEDEYNLEEVDVDKVTDGLRVCYSEVLNYLEQTLSTVEPAPIGVRESGEFFLSIDNGMIESILNALEETLSNGSFDTFKSNIMNAARGISSETDSGIESMESDFNVESMKSNIDIVREHLGEIPEFKLSCTVGKSNNVYNLTGSYSQADVGSADIVLSLSSVAEGTVITAPESAMSLTDLVNSWISDMFTGIDVGGFGIDVGDLDPEFSLDDLGDYAGMLESGDFSFDDIQAMLGDAVNLDDYAGLFENSEFNLEDFGALFEGDSLNLEGYESLLEGSGLSMDSVYDLISMFS